ncbi:hypothetical protein GCM10009642_65300 [Nocardiopsis metallicus]
MVCGNCDLAWRMCRCVPAWIVADPQFRTWVRARDLTPIVRFLLTHTELRQTQVGAVLGGLRQGTISKINSGALRVQDRRTLEHALARFQEESLPSQVSAPAPREPLTGENPTWGEPGALACLDTALAHQPTRRSAMATAGSALVMGWALADTPSTGSVADPPVSDALCEQMAELVDAIRMADAQGGASAALRASVRPQLEFLRRLLDEAAVTPAQRRQLMSITADLTGLAGWMAVDAGDADAQQLLTAGLRLAHAAQDPLLGAGIISYLAVHAYSQGQGQEAALMASTALHRVQGLASPRVECLLWIRQARGHSASGDELRARTAVEQAQRAFAQGPREEDPRWLYWIDEGEVACQSGTVLLETGHPEQALAQIDRALLGYSPAHRRNQASAQVRAAKTLIGMGEPEEASVRAHRVLDQITDLNSGRTTKQVRDLLAQLSPHRDLTDVAEVFDRARPLLEPAP